MGAMLTPRLFAIGALVAATTLSAPATAFSQATAPAHDEPSAEVQHAITLCRGRAEPSGVAPFFRTELYFGSNKPDGTAVTPEQFQDFLNTQVTPRFPDGLTLLTGFGQFRGSSGVIEKERSM